MVYTFIPRLPTASAWANRAFRDQHSLQAIVEEVAKKPRYFNRGQILFTDWTSAYTNRSHTFSGVQELKQILEGLKWDPATISKICLYEYGYFSISPCLPNPFRPAGPTE